MSLDDGYPHLFQQHVSFTQTLALLVSRAFRAARDFRLGGSQGLLEQAYGIFKMSGSDR